MVSANDDIRKAQSFRTNLTGVPHDVKISKKCNNYSMTRGIRLQVTYNFNTSRSKYKGTGAPSRRSPDSTSSCSVSKLPQWRPMV